MGIGCIIAHLSQIVIDSFLIGVMPGWADAADTDPDAGKGDGAQQEKPAAEGDNALSTGSDASKSSGNSGGVSGGDSNGAGGAGGADGGAGNGGVVRKDAALGKYTVTVV